MADILVISYDLQWASPVNVTANYYWNADHVSPSAFVPETNTHFLGRFIPKAHSLLPGLRQNADTVAPSAFISETNTHFLGRFAPTRYTLLASLRQNVYGDGVFVSAQPETNTHFLGRFTPTAYSVLALLRQNADTNAPGAFVPETNTHFLGRFTAPVFARFRYNTWDTSIPQPETNTHFLGRFTSARHVLLPGLRQNVPSDIFVPPVAETNTHFLGRFVPSAYVLPTGLRHNADTNFPGAFVPETNPHFLGKFTPPVISQAAIRLMGRYETCETSAPVTVSQSDWLVRHRRRHRR
jgi:hypothetical protein